jgi:opacity protein-like surface antigen
VHAVSQAAPAVASAADVMNHARRSASVGIVALWAAHGAGAVLWPAAAAADPRPLPMAQPFETLVEDKIELEQRVDAVPVLLARETTDGAPGGVTGLRAALSTELRLGWSDRLELGVSVGIRQDASQQTPSLRLTGFGQRARLRLADAGDWPVDVAVQVSLGELHDGASAAERLIASWRTGPLVVLGNFEVEQRYGSPNREWKHTFLATAGVGYELTPRVAIGAEYWVRGRFDEPRFGPIVLDDPDDPRDSIFHYAGPAVFVTRGRLWVAAAAHVRLDAIPDGAPVGDPFGVLWVRALIGLEL